MNHGPPTFAFPELTPAVKRLLLVNAAVFLVNAVLVGRLGTLFACSWAGLWEGYGLGLLRLVSYQFVHDWHSLGHVFWNMLTLYFFGTMAERSLGYRGVYRLYLLGGVVAALAQLLVLGLQGETRVLVIGASGSCYAFLLYAAAMAPRATVLLLFIPVPLGWLAAALVFFGVYSTYVEFVTGYPSGVAHSAHLGGAAFGFAAQRLGWLRDFRPYAYDPGIVAGWRGRWRQRRQQQKARAEAAERAELDRVLEKVHRQGLQSLSRRERRRLERASERARR